MGTSPVRLPVLFVALWALTLVGCSDKFTIEELAGTYTLNVGPGVDSVELRSDGIYIHSYQDSNVPKNESSGTWQLDTTPDGEFVTLNDFKPLPGENTTGRGYYLLKPMHSFGSIRLMRNIDLNESYSKR